jgi:predicted secreted protein
LTNGSNFEEIQNTPKKSVTEVAKDVIAGKYGNDPERSKKLTAEGYDAKAVQAEVNKMLNVSKPAKTTTTYEVTGLSSYLNVRKSPNGAIVGELHNGDRVEVVSISNGWAKLSNGNYIFDKYIKKV